jgi:hypothetical protein
MEINLSVGDQPVRLGDRQGVGFAFENEMGRTMGWVDPVT